MISVLPPKGKNHGNKSDNKISGRDYISQKDDKISQTGKALFQT